MKIAMIYPRLSSEKGICAYSHHLIRSLKKQNVDIKPEQFTARHPFSLIKKLRNLLKYDIIHLQHEYNLLGYCGIPYFFILFFFRLFKKKSLIVTLHTIISQSEKFNESSIKTFLRKSLYFFQNRMINHSSALIIVHAEFYKDILSKEYSIPEEKIVVIPHGIIEDIEITNTEEAKKELKLSGPVYLIIGTFVFDHGADIILKQADKIGKTILVVSNVDNKSESRIQRFAKLNKKIVKENNFEEYVRFDFKEIPYDLWWKYFCAADLVLLPYRGGIGSGIFADAMAVKKPVIVSNIKYFREIAEKYDCIKIAENDTDFPKVIKEAMKPKNYKKMCEECQRYFTENDLSSIGKMHKDAYQLFRI